jgi:TonB family protein
LIAVIVDARGYPQNPRVIRSLGIGLDEKALEAVQRYRFRPAMKDGKPVAAMISVQVDFRLF